MESFKQLRRRRMASGIGRPTLAREMECSESWIRLLEVGYEGAGNYEWCKRYRAALEALIAERKAARK